MFWLQERKLMKGAKEKKAQRRKGKAFSPKLRKRR